MVAAEWISEYPNDFKGAVLINTSFRGTAPATKRLSLHAATRLMRIIAMGDLAEQEKAVLKLTTVKAEFTDEAIAERVRARRERPTSRSNFFRQLFAGWRYRLPQEKPSRPVLLLSSLGDKLVHPDCADALARMWDATLERHPWAGHDLPLDDPQWVADQVAQWLSRLQAHQRAEASSGSSIQTGS